MYRPFPTSSTRQRYHDERSLSPRPAKRYRPDSSPADSTLAVHPGAPSIITAPNTTAQPRGSIPIPPPNRPFWPPQAASPVSPPHPCYLPPPQTAYAAPHHLSAPPFGSPSPPVSPPSRSPLDAEAEATYTSTPSHSPAPSDVAWLEMIEQDAETYSHSTHVSPIMARTIGLPAIGGHNHPGPPPHFVDAVEASEALRSGGGHQGLDVGGPGKPFKCSICPKSFTRNYDLSRHLSSHTDQRQHVCPSCGRAFNRRDALTRHNVIRGCGQQQQQTLTSRSSHRSASPPSTFTSPGGTHAHIHHAHPYAHPNALGLRSLEAGPTYAPEREARDEDGSADVWSSPPAKRHNSGRGAASSPARFPGRM